MSVRIRMKMFGRKHQHFFRVCVIDKRKNRQAKPIEEVGTYDARVKDKAARVKLNMERIEYWLSVGAQPTDHVAALIKKVKTNDFGVAKEPPPATAPKPLPVPAAPEAGEAAPAEGGEAPPAEG